MFARGFLPPEDPLERLPGAAFAPWEALVARLPGLLCAQNVRAAVAALPEVDTSTLQSARELERAMLLLSMFGHAFVWGERERVRRLPRCVAVPWCAVAARLGRRPVLSHASLVLSNFRRIDTSRPVELGNIAALHTFYGGLDESWFYLTTTEIEQRGAPVCEAALRVAEAAREGRAGAVAEELGRVAACIDSMRESLDKMLLGCDPYVFFNRVRLFLSGWKGNPDMPHGLVYEGVFGDEPQFFHGGSAAQSSLVVTLDALLGIEHKDKDESGFLCEMLEYMPRAHREFVTNVRADSVHLQTLLASPTCDEAVRDAYEQCVARLRRFRDRHIQIVALYIISQVSKPRAANPAVPPAPSEKEDEKKREKGTGGTSIMPFLKAVRDATQLK